MGASQSDGWPCGHAAGESTVLVRCGPVVGKVTATTANILLEVDETAPVTCRAVPLAGGAPAVSSHRRLEAGEPGVFRLTGLRPGTAYALEFSPVAGHQSELLRQKGCIVRTMKADSDLDRLRIIALSCDYPTRMGPQQVNLWDTIAKKCKDGDCDIMLHLGDQVYTWENACMPSAVREFQFMEEAHLGEALPEVLRRKLKARAFKRLQESYRFTWSQPSTAAALAHASHLMIWSDNDVTNDFTVLRKEDGSQEYLPEFLCVAMDVYRTYQRALWDPDYAERWRGREPPGELQEWHFHRYGPCGIFFIDMRSNRIHPDGTLKPGLPSLVSDAQKAALEEAFKSPGMTCMLVCAEIPFVGDNPQSIQEKARAMPFLKDHWPYELGTLTWLFDLCFTWRAAAAGREVLLLAGDIHVGVDSEISDSVTGTKLRAITASPITNDAGPFHPATEGRINERYTYRHRPLPAGQRNFCAIDLVFKNGGVEVSAQLVSQADVGR